MLPTTTGPGVEADAHGRTRRPRVRRSSSAYAASACLDGQGCGHGARRVVLVRDGRAEQRHDAVAGELVHRAFVAVHRLHQVAEAAVHDGVQVFRVETRRQRGEARDVGEEHGHLLALALEGAARW